MDTELSGRADQRELPDEIVDAILSAARETETRETWLPENRGVFLRVMPRLVGVAHRATRTLPEDAAARKMIRQNTLRILAYTRPDLRLATLMDLALRDPETLRDLMCFRIDGEYEPYRYNIITSLGIFSRHGLLKAVTTPDRIERVSGAFMRARSMRSSSTNKEEAR